MNLIDILVYTRRHGSKSEANFLNHYLIPMINELGYTPELDEVGNVWVETAPKEKAPFLFVAHIDTCHQKDEGMLTPVIRGNIVSMNPKDVRHGCLGADDGVGIYANLRMMEAGVDGTYLFTRGEEKGGIGASHIAHYTPDRLEGYVISIEVDRAGTNEIICSQSYGECASEEFSNKLGEAIGMGQKASHMGVYTDVSEFAHIIPENVNISAGYENQHTVKETVDLDYVERLINRLIIVDYASLPVVREAKDFGDDIYGYERTYQANSDELLQYITLYPERVAHFLEVIGSDTYEIEAEWSDVSCDEQLAVGMF